MAAQHSHSASASSSRPSLVSRMSSRKRPREPMMDKDPEETLRREKAGQSLMMSRLKLCCVLDPSRRFRSFKSTEGEVSWVEWECPEGSQVKMLLSCPELKGYVFPVPLCPNTVKIYDWVSYQPELRVPALTLWIPGICGHLLPSTGRLRGEV